MCHFFLECNTCGLICIIIFSLLSFHLCRYNKNVVFNLSYHMNTAAASDGQQMAVLALEKDS